MSPGSLACFAAAAAVACGRPEPPPLTGRAPAPPRPTTPAPSVTWRNRDIAITGLPAIADDGSSVVIAHRESDGGRGNPNLILLEKDRSDRVVGRLEVITATEVDQLDAAAIARRFDAAARWLEERHATRYLVALLALEAHAPTDEAQASATGAGAIIHWMPSVLVIDLGLGLGLGPGLGPGLGSGSGSAAASGHRPGSGSAEAPPFRIVRTTPPTWLVADRPLCASCTEICHNDAVLGGGYFDRARRLAIVVISYRGSDTCWEPGPAAHVVVW